MGGVHGTKELQELAIGSVVLVKEIRKLAEDGVQLADLAALYSKYQSDAEFKAKLDAAFKDIVNAKVEMAEMDLSDYLDVGMALAQELKK